MAKDTILYVIIAALTGFIAGFLLANTLNRNEMTMMRAQSNVGSSSNTSSTAASGEPQLSNEELNAKIAEADANPGDFAFQKGLGLGLYRYATMQQEIRFLIEADRILTRASELNATDYEVLVGLGHARFDIAFNNRDAKLFEEARGIYLRALAIRPDDPDVRTDLGIAYFLPESPDFPNAETELKRVIENNPRHDRSLQWLVQVYLRQKKVAEAEAALAKLREISPTNTAISELTAALNSVRSGN